MIPMIQTPPSGPLSIYQRAALLLTAIALTVTLFLLRGGAYQNSPLDQLANRSADPDSALVNKRPTMLEFYADWCEICREMAPAVLTIEQRYGKELDVVLVNVDNPRWLDLIDRYSVNGIPHIELFDGDGRTRGRSLGLRSAEQLESLARALIENTPLPELAGVGTTNIFTSSEQSIMSS